MKLMHSEYDFSLEIQENRVNVLVIENRALLAEIVQELVGQCDGAEGRFILAEGNKVLAFNKSVNLLMDIFTMNCNEKKIITKLHQEIEELSLENLVQESMEIKTAVLCYLGKLCDQTSYHLEYVQNFMPSAIMKMADLKFCTEATSLLEKIIEYLEVVNKVFKYHVNIFVNLKLFLTEEEIRSLYEYVFYHKINLVLVEARMDEKIEDEQVTIIDVDKCIIKL